MIRSQVDTWGFNIAIHRMVKALALNAEAVTLQQTKLLCLDLARAAPPRPRGVKGLAASIPKIWGKKIQGNMGAIVKGARALSLFHIARLNDASIFRNGFYPTKALNTRRVKGYYRTATGAVRETYAGSALYRINQAAQKDPQKALKNLRQVLKNHLGGFTPVVHNNFMGKAVDAYYDATRKKAQSGSRKAVDRVYINTPDPRQERAQEVANILPHIGTVKAGWIQAGLAIPHKGGAKVPAWLLNKRQVGSGSATTSQDMRISIALTNGKGNAIGIDDRTNYVNKTLRWRKNRMLTYMENALKAQARKWHNKNFGSTPLALAPSKGEGEEPPY